MNLIIKIIKAIEKNYTYLLTFIIKQISNHVQRNTKQQMIWSYNVGLDNSSIILHVSEIR